MSDDQFPADARALLAAGRNRMGPDAATVARLRARVEAAVVVGAIATGASASASAAPASATAASTTAASTTAASTTVASVAAKSIAVKLVLIATVGTSAYVAHDVVTKDRSVPDVTAPRIATTGAPEETKVERDIVVAAPEPAPPEPVPAEPVSAEPLPAEPSPVEPAPAVGASRHTTVATPPTQRAVEPPHATLSREIELVDRATVAVRGSDLDAALATLRAYDAETIGHGQLAQDAAALHIEVLCRMHDAAAIGELVVFDKRWPRSPQRSHLTTVCTEVSK